MEFATFVVTTKGQALMTKLIQTADTADFTNIGISSHVYAQEDLEALETLADVEQTAEITYKAPISATAFKIRGAVDNSELDTGYTINTIGVYADDPDDGEILYAVGRATVSGWMPAYNGVTVSGAYFEFTITVGNAAQVEVTVDPAGYAAIGDLAAEISTRAAADTALSQDIAKLQSQIGIVVDGNSAAVNVASGQYVIVKNSTITGITDGLYTYSGSTTKTAGNSFTSSELTAVPTGGLNSLYDKLGNYEVLAIEADHSDSLVEKTVSNLSGFRYISIIGHHVGASLLCGIQTYPMSMFRSNFTGHEFQLRLPFDTSYVIFSLIYVSDTKIKVKNPNGHTMRLLIAGIK